MERYIFLNNISFLGSIQPDTKIACNQNSDCNIDIETCHEVLFLQEGKNGYCGPKHCQKIEDCTSIGNLHYGMLMAEECQNNFCIYSKAEAMA